MELFRPYAWLKEQNSQFNLFFYISVPSGYRIIGLQSPTDNTTTGIRLYNYQIEAATGGQAFIVDSSTGNHYQPANISKIELRVVDISDPIKPVKKGEVTVIYQDADDLS